MNQRTALLESPSARGLRLARDLAVQTDAWLVELWSRARDQVRVDGSVCLVALGGYGRGELAPYSDVDVMLVHEGQSNIEALAGSLWYPIWDAGVKLGHSVCTVKQALKRADEDLESATAMLSARIVADLVEADLR